MDATAILARFLDEPRVARVRAVLDTYGHAAGGLLANGLAFSTLFAAIPTMLLILGLAGAVANDPTVRQTVGDALIAAFPPLEDLIAASSASSGPSASCTAPSTWRSPGSSPTRPSATSSGARRAGSSWSDSLAR
jgi:hypothetical protein